MWRTGAQAGGGGVGGGQIWFGGEEKLGARPVPLGAWQSLAAGAASRCAGVRRAKLQLSPGQRRRVFTGWRTCPPARCACAAALRLQYQVGAAHAVPGGAAHAVPCVSRVRFDRHLYALPAAPPPPTQPQHAQQTRRQQSSSAARQGSTAGAEGALHPPTVEVLLVDEDGGVVGGSAAGGQALHRHRLLHTGGCGGGGEWSANVRRNRTKPCAPRTQQALRCAAANPSRRLPACPCCRGRAELAAPPCRRPCSPPARADLQVGEGGHRRRALQALLLEQGDVAAGRGRGRCKGRCEEGRDEGQASGARHREAGASEAGRQMGRFWGAPLAHRCSRFFWLLRASLLS